MGLPLETLVTQIAKELSAPPERLVRGGIVSYLHQAFREVSAEILGDRWQIRR